MKLKRIIYLIVCAFIIQACGTESEQVDLTNVEQDINLQQSDNIEFQVKITDPEDLEIFEDGYIPWVSIKDPSSDIINLVDADKIVLNEKSVLLMIDYPLENAVEINISANSDQGFTRSDLIRTISQEYLRIYAEEEESTKIEVQPMEERGTLINRNETNGKYGICCHDIDDLDLSRINVSILDDGRTILYLMVES
jgi:hypothetical protein